MLSFVPGLDNLDFMALAHAAFSRGWYDSAIDCIREVLENPTTDINPVIAYGAMLKNLKKLSNVVSQTQNHYLKTRKDIFDEEWRLKPYFVDGDCKKKAKQPKWVKNVTDEFRPRDVMDPLEFQSGELKVCEVTGKLANILQGLF